MDLVRASRIMPVIIATSARRATINSPNVYVSKPERFYPQRISLYNVICVIIDYKICSLRMQFLGFPQR